MSRRDEEFVGVGQPLVRLPGLFPTGYPVPLPQGAPSPSLVTTPGFSLPARPLVAGSRKAWWWLQAFAVKCPTCPKTVLATIGPFSMTAAQFAPLVMNYQKSGTQLQIRRQRRADEADPGAWYYVMWPGGNILTLEQGGGSKV